jgi:hypothetical protein
LRPVLDARLDQQYRYRQERQSSEEQCKMIGSDQFLRAAENAKQLLDGARRADAVLAARTADVLEAVQIAVRALGHEAQDLHEQIARLDLQAPSAEASIADLSSRVGRYQRDDNLSSVLIGARGVLVDLRSEFAKQVGHRAIGRRSEAMAHANAKLNTVIDDLEGFIGAYLMLAQYLPSGTGIGAQTLGEIDGWLSSGTWRNDPQSARDCWKQAAVDFRLSPDYRKWQDLEARLARTRQQLLTLFPQPPRPG